MGQILPLGSLLPPVESKRRLFPQDHAFDPARQPIHDYSNLCPHQKAVESKGCMHIGPKNMQLQPADAISTSMSRGVFDP